MSRLHDMSVEQMLELAERIARDGQPKNFGWYDDGDGESGPMGGVTPVIGLDGFELANTTNGTCYLADQTDEAWAGSFVVFGSHAGSGHWGGRGADHWRDERRYAIRQAVETRCEGAPIEAAK